MMKKGLLLIVLLGLAMADNFTVTLDCKPCANDTCIALDGGPFDNYELPISSAGFATCNASGLRFNNTFLFFCDPDKCKNDTCNTHYSDWLDDHCSDFFNSQIKALNLLYGYMKGNQLETYPWCKEACSGTGFPTWLIIVIAVVGVLVLVGVGVGIWWWLKKRGGKLPNMDDYANADTRNLLK